MIIIPIEQLDQDTCNAVLEEFVTREGTEYGLQEVLLATKIAQVRRQIERGEACLCYDPVSQTCNVLPAAEAKQGINEQ